MKDVTVCSRRIDLLDFWELPGVGWDNFEGAGVEKVDDWKKAEKANALESSDWEAMAGSTCSTGGAIYVNCGTCNSAGRGPTYRLS